MVMFNINLERMLDLPFNVYWKDKSGCYLGCNDKLAELLSLQSRSDIIDKKLQNFCTKETTLVIENTDNTVMHKNQTICIIEYADHVKKPENAYLSIKSPLYRNNKNNTPIGMFGLSLSLTSLHSNKHLSFISQLGFNISAQNMIKNVHVQYYSDEIEGVKLSRRESECLYYLKQGRTSKETAKLLNLSPRTVESYIENIKIKLNCYSKSELLDKLFKI